MYQLRKSMLATSILFAITNGSLLISNKAIAQESEASTEEIEIISISRKRPETLQEVPIAVTALSAKVIENAGIERPGDAIALIPNVTMVDTANVGDTQVTIRGIVSTRDAESTFAYVVDGVLMTNPNGFNKELLDVSQIEVLKGPQGALYGRNAVAGAIIVTTKLPSDELEGSFKIGLANNNTRKVNALISGPLSDTVRGRLTASFNTTDGFYENTFTGADDVVDYLEDSNLRGRIIWDVSEDFTLDFRAAMSKVESGAINFNASFALPSFVAANEQPAYLENVNDHDFIFAFNVPGVNKQETQELSLKADWDLDGVDVTAVFAYNNLEETLISDGTSASFYSYELTDQCQTDRATLNNLPTSMGGAGRSDLYGEFFAPFGILPPGADFTGVYGPYTPSSCDGYQYQERSQSDFSGEVRLTSDDNSASLRWVAGVYFAEIEREVVVAYGADTGQGFLQQAYVPPSGPNPTDLLFDDTFNTSVLSAFGQIEYDLNEQWELSAALRYDYEDRDVSNNVPNVKASGLNTNTYVNGEVGAINPAFNTNPDGIPDRNSSFSHLQPKVTLAYAANDALNWYASYGVGFRSGGFNSIGTKATLDYWYNTSADGTTPGDAVDAQLIVNDEYDKEVTTNIELGFKVKLADGKVKLNAAVFNTTVDDNQFFEFFAGPFGLLRAVTTIEELSIQGFELDISAQVTEDISLFGGLGLLDTKIKENQNRPSTVGNNAPQTPDKTFTLGANWEYSLTENVVMNTRLDWQYVGETDFHTLQGGENTPTIWSLFLGGEHPVDFSKASRDAYNTLNLRVSFDTEAWNLAVWAKNLTDEEYLQEVIPAPEFGGSFTHPSARDSYGIDLTYRF